MKRRVKSPLSEKARIDIQVENPLSEEAGIDIQVENPLSEEAGIDIHAAHRRRLDYIMITFGVAIVAAVLLAIYWQVPMNRRQEIWGSAILGIALASISLGIAGDLTVKFQKYGLLAQGTLGFGVFILVFVASLYLTAGC